MKTELIQKQIEKLLEDNRKKSETIAENNKKIEELKKKKQAIEMTEFITVISKKGMDLNTLKSRIINNEISLNEDKGDSNNEKQEN